jgi:hypothetical protein
MENTTQKIVWEMPVAGDEVESLLGSLERQRATFAWKCGGLGPEGLQARLGPSAMTLGGLLKHMAGVEDEVFSVRLHGNGRHAPFDADEYLGEPDWEWRTAAGDSPEQLVALWYDAVERSHVLVAEAIADGGLDRPSAWVWPDGRTPSLRRLLLDMIEEYGRHVGHADLIRESVDGLVGEDPPR